MTALYQPSNGTEGMCFIESWCGRCARDQSRREGEEHGCCQILTNTMAYKVTDPEYPREWTYNDAGRPICTAFTHVAPAERDPRQLQMFA